MIETKKFIISKNYLIYFSIFIHLFYFDQKINIGSIEIDLRASLLLLLIPVILKKLKLLKKIFFYYLLILLFFFLHSIVTKYSIQETNYSFINLKNILICLFLAILIFYNRFIYISLYRLIYIFLITFPFIYILSRLIIFLNYPDHGSFLDVFSYTFGEIRVIYFEKYQIKYLPYLFKEQSHLNMLAPLILINSQYLFKIIKKKFMLIFSLIFFNIILIFNFSSTLFYGFLITSFLIYIFNFKSLKKGFQIILGSYILLFIFISQFDLKINNTFNDLQESFKNIEKTIITSDKDFQVDSTYFKKQNSEYDSLNIKSLSYEVMLFNLKLSLKATENSFLGHGLNSYPFVHQIYKDYIPSKLEGSNWLNYTNGTNVFIKSLAEFGLIILIFGFGLIYLFISNKVSLRKKIIITSGITTILIVRGAGYVNSGFLIFFALYIFQIYILIKDLFLNASK